MLKHILMTGFVILTLASSTKADPCKNQRTEMIRGYSQAEDLTKSLSRGGSSLFDVPSMLEEKPARVYGFTRIIDTHLLEGVWENLRVFNPNLTQHDITGQVFNILFETVADANAARQARTALPLNYPHIDQNGFYGQNLDIGDIIETVGARNGQRNQKIYRQTVTLGWLEFLLEGDSPNELWLKEFHPTSAPENARLSLRGDNYTNHRKKINGTGINRNNERVGIFYDGSQASKFHQPFYSGRQTSISDYFMHLWHWGNDETQSIAKMNQQRKGMFKMYFELAGRFKIDIDDDFLDNYYRKYATLHGFDLDKKTFLDNWVDTAKDWMRNQNTKRNRLYLYGSLVILSSAGVYAFFDPYNSRIDSIDDSMRHHKIPETEKKTVRTKIESFLNNRGYSTSKIELQNELSCKEINVLYDILTPFVKPGA